jgi:hypothetical protein
VRRDGDDDNDGIRSPLTMPVGHQAIPRGLPRQFLFRLAFTAIGVGLLVIAHVRGDAARVAWALTAIAVAGELGATLVWYRRNRSPRRR